MRVQKSATQIPVFDHVAHRAFFDFGVVEMQNEWRRAFARAPVADLDLEHWLRMIRATLLQTPVADSNLLRQQAPSA